MQAVSAQVSAIAHATEDADKVVLALNIACARELSPSRTETRKLRGHYGNEIATFTLSLRGRSVESFVRNLWSMLPNSDRALILRDLDSRIDDDGRLHMRLDKQLCLRYVFRLRDQDPIKIQLAFRAKTGSGVQLRDGIRHFFETLQDS